MKIPSRSFYILLTLLLTMMGISACSSDSTATSSSATVVGLSTADNTQLLNE